MLPYCTCDMLCGLHWIEVALRFCDETKVCNYHNTCGRLCIFVNKSWCTISKEVLRFCLPEVEYLMISCRQHYLPREFSSVFFVAVYIPPQSNASTKTTLNELYSAISKQENAQPEATFLVAGDFNAGKCKSVNQLPRSLTH